jgi:hypothetical protein
MLHKISFIKRQPWPAIKTTQWGFLGQVKLFLLANGISLCDKENFTIGPLKWLVFPQAMGVI